MMQQAPAPRDGLFEDVMDVFVSPAALFARQRDSGWARPAVIQSVLFLVLVVALKNLVSPYFDAEFERGMAAAAAKGQAMPAGAVETSRKLAGFLSIAGPVLAPWFVGVFGGLFTMLGARVVGATLSFKQSATIAVWSYFPAVVGYLATAAQGAMLSEGATVRGISDAQLGPARFLDPAALPPAVLGLLQSLDLFSVWTILLTGLGVSVVAGVPRSNGFIAGLVRWGLLAAISLVGGLLRGG